MICEDDGILKMMGRFMKLFVVMEGGWWSRTKSRGYWVPRLTLTWVCVLLDSKDTRDSRTEHVLSLELHLTCISPESVGAKSHCLWEEQYQSVQCFFPSLTEGSCWARLKKKARWRGIPAHTSLQECIVLTENGNLIFWSKRWSLWAVH